MISYIGVVSEKTWYGDSDRFDSGADFVQAFEAVGDRAPDVNPRRIVDTDSDIIARYQFDEMNEGTIEDQENDYDLQTDGTLVQRDETNAMRCVWMGQACMRRLRPSVIHIRYPLICIWMESSRKTRSCSRMNTARSI